MIGSTRAIRVFARPVPTDLRAGFNRLAGLVQTDFNRDLMQGDFFLFVNRTRTSAKVLLWDGTGLCIYSKKLSKGRFATLWSDGPTKPLTLTQAELALFIEGAMITLNTSLSPKEITRKRMP